LPALDLALSFTHTSLDYKHCVRRIALSENNLFLPKGHNLPAVSDGGKEDCGFELAFVFHIHKNGRSGAGDSRTFELCRKTMVNC